MNIPKYYMHSNVSYLVRDSGLPEFYLAVKVLFLFHDILGILAAVIDCEVEEFEY